MKVIKLETIILKWYVTATCRHPEANAELTNWGLSFDKDLLQLPARILPTEKIIQRGAKVRNITRGHTLTAPCVNVCMHRDTHSGFVWKFPSAFCCFMLPVSEKNPTSKNRHDPYLCFDTNNNYSFVISVWHYGDLSQVYHYHPVIPILCKKFGNQ